MSPASDFLEMTDAQKRKMFDEFDQLAKEMEAILKEKRKRANQIWTNNLSEEQLRKFERLRKIDLSNRYEAIGFDLLLYSTRMRLKEKKKDGRK